MRLLFITQKLHGQDTFGVLWIREFIRQGWSVTVICLEGSDECFEFPVHSLGKERGASRMQSVLRFEQLIMSLSYDRVFIHMAPVWYALGCWWWIAHRTPCYLWYTHYRMQLGVKLFGWFGRRFFCASPQSLPQFAQSPKRVVLGHGIDLVFWKKRDNRATHPHNLLVVHRLSRSKRLEILIHALSLLKPVFTVDVYGIEAESDYVEELQAFVRQQHLESRVTFHGTIAMKQLPEIYTHHRLIINMASDTIDKTMLEAMTCGCYPITTRANATAIGIPHAPPVDTPEALAVCIDTLSREAPMHPDAMFSVVQSRHSLETLVRVISVDIEQGK